MTFKCGEFIASCLEEAHFPLLRSLSGSVLPEVALVGKSNVGKSSLINFLLRSKQLAKVSSTPGKTRAINFFAIDQKIALVDLPGYGYAKVPKHMRESWANYLQEYFQNRQPLRLILLLLDIRRSPTEEDLAMAKWSAVLQKPLLVIFTKCDKSAPAELRQNMASSLAQFSKIDGLILQEPIALSVHHPHSRDQLIRAMNSVLER